MRILGIDHICIAVRDLEAARKRYMRGIWALSRRPSTSPPGRRSGWSATT